MFIVTSKTKASGNHVPSRLSQYNRSSPQHDHLKAHWVFRPEWMVGPLGSSSFSFRDWAGKYGTWLDGSNAVFANHGLGGKGLYFDETLGPYLELDLPSTFVDDIEVFTLVLWTTLSIPPDNGMLWTCCDYNGFGDANGVFETNQMNNGELRFIAGNSNGSRIVTGASYYSDGDTVCMVCRRKDGDSDFWINGEQIGTNSSLSSGTENNCGHWFNRPDTTTGNRFGEQTIIEARIYNDWIADDVIQEIWKPQSRWDLFAERKRQYFMPIAGGAPPVSGLVPGSLSLMGVGI